MWKPFEYKNKEITFTHGWDTDIFNAIKSYDFSGGNVSAYRIFPDQNIAIIVMYNGYKEFPVFYPMINQIAGMMDKRMLNPYMVAEEYTKSEPIVHPNLKKENYGYRTEKDNIIFSYQFPEGKSVEYIKSISVTGSFNNWNPDDQVYYMNLKRNNAFELTLPKSHFESGKTYQFKFVMNKKNWLSVPYNAANVDGTKDHNLTFKID